MGRHEAAVRARCAELRDVDSSVRAEAAEKLAELGARASEAVPHLIVALDDRAFMVQIWAVKALGAVGPAAAPAVPRLMRALEDEALRIHAVSALGRIGPQAAAARPLLRGLSEVRDEETRGAVAMALFAIEGDRDRAFSVLSTLLARAQSPEARMHAAADLGRMREARAVSALSRGLRDASDGVRREAACALGEIGRPAKEALQRLQMALSDRADDVRFAAAVALWKIDKDRSGIRVLVEILDSDGVFHESDPSHRAFIAARTKPVLWRVRAARALGAMGPEASAAAPKLMAALNDPSDEVRTAAGDALAQIQHARLEQRPKGAPS